ncbi:cell division protein ZipA C-terminal FtsZ-binding domain-containing protein [Kingella kingae]|nr:cell division protein ZipA C-terminal FtsZ-binding domain-containing protein [Kingella kingae]
MDGEVKFPPLNPFLANAKPLDELCARVDQTIAIHLVSRSSSVLGAELRLAVEQAGFVLQEDGVFTLTNTMGDVQYTISTLDGTAFTDALLSSQPYKGFSMLLDITRVPHGEEVFNQFIGVAVKLSSMLNLDLVDDQVRQLSTDWLKEVRSYIHARQDEMTRIGIEPGSALAKRLFA